MKRLIPLFILTWCFCTTLSAQNTTSLPAGTTSVTPAFRVIGSDSLRSLWISLVTGYNQVYTATQVSKNFKTKADSISAIGGYVTHFALLDSLKNKQTKISGQDFTGLGITGNPIRLSTDTLGTGNFIVRRGNGYLGYDNTHYYSQSDTLSGGDIAKYVSHHGGSTYTAANGLTLTGSAFNLGGTISSNTNEYVGSNITYQVVDAAQNNGLQIRNLSGSIITTIGGGNSSGSAYGFTTYSNSGNITIDGSHSGSNGGVSIYSNSASILLGTAGSGITYMTDNNNIGMLYRFSTYDGRNYNSWIPHWSAVKSRIDSAISAAGSGYAPSFSGTTAQYIKGNGTYATFPTNVSSFTNDANYLTAITGTQVTTALGYTPYNATNPSGYISANQTITISGDISGSGSTAITATLPTVNSNVGTFGGPTSVGRFTVNAKGLITAASTQNINIPESQVINLTTDLAAKQAALSIGSFSGTSSPNGLTLSSGVLTMTAASSSNPGGVSTGAQTFAGQKSFSSDIIVNSIYFGRGGSGLLGNLYAGYVSPLYTSGTGSANSNFGNSGQAILTTGSSNTNAGSNGQNTLSTANYNTNVGASGQSQILGGNGNTNTGALGLLSAPDSSAYNTTNGFKSGYGLGYAFRNTLVGAFTGPQTGSPNISGAVYLGYAAGENETGSNKLYIANSNTATPLLLGDFAAETLFINGVLGSQTPTGTAGSDSIVVKHSGNFYAIPANSIGSSSDVATNASNIAAETTRAEAAESANATNIATNTSAISANTTAIAGKVNISDTSAMAYMHLAKNETVTGAKTYNKTLYLTENGTALTPIFGSAETGLQMLGANSSDVVDEWRSFGGHVVRYHLRANGTSASPTGLLTNDEISAVIDAGGYDGTGWSSEGAYVMQAFAGSNWSSTNHEAYGVLKVTPSGSLTLTSSVKFASDLSTQFAGNVSVGKFQSVNLASDPTYDAILGVSGTTNSANGGIIWVGADANNASTLNKVGEYDFMAASNTAAAKIARMYGRLHGTTTGHFGSDVIMQTMPNNGSLTNAQIWNTDQTITFPHYTTNGGFFYGDASGNLTQSSAITGLVYGNGTSAPTAATTGQVTLVSGAKTVTISGLTTSSQVVLSFVSAGGTVSTTWQYAGVCTANTLTITALTNTGSTDTTDTSTLNYMIIN